jgi:hypothetical protein
MTRSKPELPGGRSEFLQSVRRGVFLGAATLALVLPPAVVHFSGGGVAEALPQADVPHAVTRHAAFRAERPSSDVRRMADWVITSQDNGSMFFVIVDKKQAKVFLFDPQGSLMAAAPALLGSARGDDTVPGIGSKPMDLVLPEEKTTPAGRFVAELGASSSRKEDVVWVDYDAAVSMHRILKLPERLKGIASPSPEDKRMSFGCINLPDAFYENVLLPAVQFAGAVIYVLPETRSLRQTFAAYYEVDAPVKLAKLAQH